MSRAHRRQALDELDSSASEDLEEFNEDVNPQQASDASEDDASPPPQDDSDAEEDTSDSEIDSEPELSAPKPKPSSHLTQLRQIPFGTLAQAASSLPTSTSRKPRKSSNSEPSPALQSLRDRLAEIKAARQSSNHAKSSRRKRHTQENTSDSDSAPQEANSKHAPSSQSSRKPVSRKRSIIPDLSRNPTHSRDPRFHASVKGYVNQDAIAKNYAFLTQYQQSELDTLRADLKKTKDPAQKDQMQRKVNSMSNKMKAAEAREREKQVLKDVRRKERESVKQGKKPFFMKKGEIKKKVRQEILGDLTEKERAKRDERREKKRSGKELKRKPDERRRPLA